MWANKYRAALIAACLATLGLFFPNGKPAQAQTLDQAMTLIANELDGYLKLKSVGRIAVGKFEGPQGSGSGDAMTEMLSGKLKVLGYSRPRVGGMQVRGRFLVRKQKNHSEIRLFAELYDKSGAKINEWATRFKKQFSSADGETGAKVSDTSDVANIAGVSSVDTTKPNSNLPENDQTQPQDRAKALSESIDNAAIHVENNIVSPRKGSFFAVEILVKGPNGYASKSVVAEEGYAFVELGNGDVFAIRLINDAPYDVAVKLTLDGVNCFAFSKVESHRRGGIWIIPRKGRGRFGGRGLITGWHHQRGAAHEFLVTSLPDGAASKLGKSIGQIGTIQAQFFVAWPVGEGKPNVEVLGARGSAEKSIGSGARVEQPEVPVIRNVGKSMLAAVTIRYEHPGPPDDLPQEGPPPK